MIKIADYNDNFIKDVENSKNRVVICGIKDSFITYLPYVPRADYLWSLEEIENNKFGIPIITTEDIINLKEEIYLLICVNDNTLFSEILELLKEVNLDVKIYNLFFNSAFNFFRGDYTYKYQEEKRPLKVRIINYDGGGWILTKFAQRLNDYLNDMGVIAEIGQGVDPSADINHHIPSHPYTALANYNDTLMITHVDCQQKIDLLKHQLQIARMGICMSRETMNMLASAGIPRQKLCYINPAHDNNMKPKKYIIGITHKRHEYDLRKRMNALIDMLTGVNPDFFKFKIMGSGWQEIVEQMRQMGFEVDYYDDFDYELYHELMPTLDYYMFFGFDEGSMGYLDALAAGVKTIVTPQGFHLDVEGGIDYACRTVDQFANILYDLQYEREKRIASVSDWTWENYAMKHIEIWKYITGRDSIQNICRNQHLYEDGIFSCLLSNNVII